MQNQVAVWVNQESRGVRIVDAATYNPRSSEELLEYARVLAEEARLADLPFTVEEIRRALEREAQTLSALLQEMEGE